MLIHCAGCDGVGKSTITDRISERLNIGSTHFSNPKDIKDGKNQYFNFLNSTDSDKNYICDRFHDGEWVYAPIYRGYVANYMDEIEKKIIKKHNYLLVYVTATLDTIIKRTRVRGEDFVKEEHFQTVLDNYKNNYLMNQKMPFTIIDTTNNDPETCVQMALHDVRNLDLIWDVGVRNCAQNRAHCGVLSHASLPWGNIRAKYMIVGQNPGGRGKDKQEFTQIWSGGRTSEFFLNILKEAGIYLDCWFTNAVLCSTADNKVTTKQAQNCYANLKTQIKTIKPEIIFTLGKEATNIVKNNFPNENIIEVPHPTYIKRFYSGKPEKIEEYINMFRR